ncbi:GNAT family N-acetyltransferase [Kitasatospora sp. NBC_00240]|uniref:GNAT family N-acetyltransferase n=1 Tax=Kitasatospora sp. NBC_00240 TaxID=2903567 RepID=UPI002255F67D|nr:GNAT family N-acetyltransferase [Kitasatospora sp. NBC_00240]MCX5211221.1 GNAT family N-acetyltransferase [Kitasatospora sp. NBC_00240]
MASELARAWVAGWVASRATAAPVAEPWGLRIEVGHPKQVTRHVLFDTDANTVRELARAITAPTTWIKAFVEPGTIAPHLSPQDWAEDIPGFLMAADLRPAPVHAPDGYTLSSDTAQGVTRVRILAPDGSLAARGQIAPTGASAVVDQVETEPAHQRRGLGTVVMRSLGNTALDQGAGTGILGATIEGRALYESLGWTVRAPLAGFIYRAASD